MVPQTLEGRRVSAIGPTAFGSCYLLETLTLPDGLNDIGSLAFFECESLKRITIPDSVTSMGDNPFSLCPAEVIISPMNPVFEVDDGAVFDKAQRKLVSYLYGNEQTTWIVPTGTEIIGARAFDLCSSLTRVDLPKGLVAIEDEAFIRCVKLTDIAPPDSVKEIGVRAFSECFMLPSIALPEGLTRLGDYAFAYCENLKEVTFPEGPESIGKFAFLEAGIAYPSLPRSLVSIGRGTFESSSLAEVIVYPGSAAEAWALNADVPFSYVGEAITRFDREISRLTCSPYGNLVNLASITSWQDNIGYCENNYHITALTPDAARRIVLAPDRLYGFIPAGDRIAYLGSDAQGNWGTIMDIAGDEAATEQSPLSGRSGWSAEKLPLREDAWAFYADEDGIRYVVPLENEANEIRIHSHDEMDEVKGTCDGVVVAVMQDNSVLINDLYRNRLLLWRDGKEKVIFSPKEEMNYVRSFGRGVWTAFKNGYGPVKDGEITMRLGGQFWNVGGTTDQFVLLTRPHENADHLTVTLFNEKYSAYVPLGNIALSNEMRIELTPREIIVWATLKTLFSISQG